MIIELQRRMVERGRIRAGDRALNGAPRKLDKWRLTSKDRQTLAGAAKLWGGEVREWEEHAGEFELYTDTDSLPIMLLPGQAPTTWYEMWSRGGCQRRCDGQHELISDSACLCGEERECKPHTRLSVLLPDLPGIGSWLLSSTGWNAAAELAGAADLLQRASAQGVLIPARLRLEQRVQVTGGQTRRFAVPVIDVDVSFRELLGGNRGELSTPSDKLALPSGYVPLAGNGQTGVSLSEGLTAAETQTVARGARSAEPIPETDAEFEPSPIAVEDVGASALPPELGRSDTGGAPATHEENIAALNALVSQLAEAGEITKRQVWVAVARMRKLPVDDMIELLKGKDEQGEVRWSSLRDSLEPHEAVELRSRLGHKWAATQ
jgi:hypothetical protein